MTKGEDPILIDPMVQRITSGTLKGEVLKLDIGAGGPVFERNDFTWTTVDKYAPADVEADMWDLPYEDGAVDAIWSSHALEHVPMKMVNPTLTEWYRVLRPGGKLTVLVPDFDYAAQMWMQVGPPALGHIFGSQAHEGEFHKMAWNLESLVEDVEYAGFKVSKSEVLWTPAYTQYSIRVEAIKP